MDNSNIEKSLEELEQSLIQINSARSQVSNVAEKSEQLILSVSSAIKVITGLNSGVNGELEAFIKDLESRLSKLDGQITKFSSNSDRSVQTANENFTELSNTLKSNIIEVEKAFSNFINEFEKTNKKIKEFDLSDEFRQLKLVMNSAMSSFETAIKSQIDEVVKNQMEIVSNKIVSRLDTIENTTKSMQNRNMIVLIAGIIIVCALILIFELK